MIKRPKPERFRLRRTMMFMNAQKPGLIKDAYIYGCDSIMLDLEDAVAENQKDAARFSLYHALTTIDYGSTEVIVRINGLDTPHWQEDIRVCVAGGADVILIPEIPYDMDQVIKTIEHRMETGSRFTIVAVAEGAISKEDAALSKKEYKKKLAERTSPSIVYDIAKEIEAKTGRETRVAIPGHTQRGGQPDAQDRIFATQCGVEAALGCLRGEFGYMIALRDGKMCHMPLEEVAGKLKYVDPQSDLVREAKALGISFGDE